MKNLYSFSENKPLKFLFSTETNEVNEENYEQIFNLFKKTTTKETNLKLDMLKGDPEVPFRKNWLETIKDANAKIGYRISAYQAKELSNRITDYSNKTGYKPNKLDRLKIQFNSKGMPYLKLIRNGKNIILVSQKLKNAKETSISAQLKKKPNIKEAQPKRNLNIKNLHLAGKSGKSGIMGVSDKKNEKENLKERKLSKDIGSFQRALRFKNLTDLVEKKYNLPSGIIFCMMIQESNGMDVLPNGTDDGGAGLCHMQPIVAKEFGLKTLTRYTNKMVDKKHGKKLRELIIEKKYNYIEIAKQDDRLNPLMNLDAVARMLVIHIHGRKITGLGPLRTAIKRYSGRYNYEHYWGNLKKYMKLLNDDKFMKKVEKDFNDRNPNLIINGEIIKTNQFRVYIKTFQETNSINMDFNFYEKNNKGFSSQKLNQAKSSYKEFMLK